MNIWKKSIVVSLFLLSLYGFNLYAEVITLTPTDDMYTDPNGTQETGELWLATFSPAGHFERIMMKFDLSGIEQTSTTQAILHLNKFFACPDGSPTVSQIFAVTDSWDENSWSVTQHANYDQNAYNTVTFDASTGWCTMDITALVNDWLNGTRANNGLMIMANNGGKFKKFYSKDHVDESLHPYLEITGTTPAENVCPEMHSALFVGNFPNPFNPETTVQFSLPQAGSVELTIYNLLGQKVKTLLNSSCSAGLNSVEWNGTNEAGEALASSIYFCCLKVDGSVRSIHKMALMK